MGKVTDIKDSLQVFLLLRPSQRNFYPFLPILSLTFQDFQATPKPLLVSLTNVLRLCVNFWVIFGHFVKEIFFLKT